MENCEIVDKYVERARDLFIFQCYTGLSYCDLAKFKWEDVQEDNGKYSIRDVRKKTDEDYFIVLLKPAMRILKKYDFRLPIISNQKYNAYLKIVGSYARLNKILYSHMARHSFGVLMLSMGVPMVNVSKMMGHANTKITEQVYAKVLNDDLKKSYMMVDEKLK